jgi:hypothetical protein
VVFFRFFAGPAPGFPEQAASVVTTELAAVDQPELAARYLASPADAQC